MDSCQTTVPDVVQLSSFHRIMRIIRSSLVALGIIQEGSNVVVTRVPFWADWALWSPPAKMQGVPRLMQTTVSHDEKKHSPKRGLLAHLEDAHLVYGAR